METVKNVVEIVSLLIAIITLFFYTQKKEKAYLRINANSNGLEFAVDLDNVGTGIAVVKTIIIEEGSNSYGNGQLLCNLLDKKIEYGNKQITYVTRMQSNLESDPLCGNKKHHIMRCTVADVESLKALWECISTLKITVKYKDAYGIGSLKTKECVSHLNQDYESFAAAINGRSEWTFEADENLTGYPSIDKPWLKYYSEEAVNSAPPECTIYRNIYESNKDFPNDTALLYFGKKISYAKMFCEIDKAAAAFTAYGIKENDNVSICMPAVPETIYAILALNKIGANAALLNPTFTEQQLTDRINETEATLMITINELYVRLENVIPNTTVKTVVCLPAVNSLGVIVKLIKKARRIKGTLTWNEFIKTGRNMKVQEVGYQSDRPAIMVYSSGTTGASKGIQLTNKSVNSTVNDGSYIGFDWKRQDRWFSQIPVWFSTGICGSTLVPLAVGVTVILEPMYDFEIFLDHMNKYRPNFIITASALLEYLRKKLPKADFYKDYKYFCIGGDYIAPCREMDDAEWLKDNGNQYGLFKGYGMCECGGTVTAANYQCNVVGSAGVPTVHAIVSAFDINTGKELKYGERGEIRVDTPCRMKGYFKKPEETEKFFHTDETGAVWACTGDMGYITEDGSVYISGRISDSYKNELEETVYLFDIERAALDIPAVRQCKAIAQEVDEKQVHVCHIAFDGAVDSEQAIKEIQTHCSNNLPASHIPYYFKIYDDALPVAPSGKLDTQCMKSTQAAIKEMK